jgi:serine/threonine protein kinase
MEKTVLMILNNPYILQGFKVAEDAHHCYMITEFCNGGTLKEEIRSSPGGCLREDRAMAILYHLLLGFKGLVEKGITHRDLKPANIMLHNGMPKIIDFGYCEVRGFARPSLKYSVGSPSYMAPESFECNIYN